ncbi:MAG TPA: NADPH:quinone oxidoreductase family protein [Xanthomonadales bacterium]|nr:NADPH:quinone oxidoreductase family protein [Xanthomonadales bacterium]
MKALVCTSWGPADTMSLQEMDDPELGPNDVRMEVHAAGLNFPDTLVIEGRYQFQPDFPFVPGAEAAGTVIEAGTAVKDYRPGDRVIWVGISGAFAERVVCPASELIRMPDTMPFHVGASLLVTYGTTYYALKQCAHVQAGEILLVLGAAGGVGLAAVDLGRAMGARVIAAASSEEKLDVACRAGATDRINYSTGSLKDEIKALTSGRGADVVYDPVGGALSEPALRGTGWNGRFLVIGFASGEIPSIPLNLPLLKNNAIIGVFYGVWAKRDPAAHQQNIRELFRLYESGAIKPLVGRVFSLDQYREAFGTLTGRKALGKVIFEIKP